MYTRIYTYGYVCIYICVCAYIYTYVYMYTQPRLQSRLLSRFVRLAMLSDDRLRAQDVQGPLLQGDVAIGPQELADALRQLVGRPAHNAPEADLVGMASTERTDQLAMREQQRRCLGRIRCFGMFSLCCHCRKHLIFHSRRDLRFLCKRTCIQTDESIYM